MTQITNIFEQFQPAPGILLIKPIEKDSELDLGTTARKMYIRKGIVMKVGDPLPTLVNGFIQSPCKVGQLVWHYAYGDIGEVDHFSVDGEKVFVVKFEDVRGWINGED